MDVFDIIDQAHEFTSGEKDIFRRILKLMDNILIGGSKEESMEVYHEGYRKNLKLIIMENDNATDS